MKITLIGPVYPYRGGIAHFNAELALKMLAKGDEVQVISFKKLYPAWLYPGKTDKDPSLNPLKVDSQFLLDPLNPFTWNSTVNTIIQFKPEVVVIHWWVTFLALAFSFITVGLRKRGFPVVFLIHNVMPHEPNLWDRSLTKLALTRGNSFIVQTNKEKNRFVNLFPGRPVVVSPHPVYDLLANKKIPKIEARHQLGITPQASVVLFFGIVRPYKGLKYLLDVIARLKKCGSNVQLIIAGECWEDISFYQHKIMELDIQDRVHFENRYIPNEEVGVYFSAADIFVAPYIGGTQSGAARIAMAFQMPSIVSEEIADEGLVNNYPTDIKVVQPANLDQFSRALNELLIKVKTGPQYNNISNSFHHDQWNDLIGVIRDSVL
jgi:glycosyltransferase involved in cell wall biosynthesis